MSRIDLRSRLLQAILLATLGITSARAADPLPSWNDGATKQRIVEFVRSVTTTGGPHFVPISQRIATFDNDGTLWSEQPAYFQLQFSIHRTRKLVGSHPEWRTTQPFKAALENDLATLTSGNGKPFLALTASTCGGLTVTEMHAEVATSHHHRFGGFDNAIQRGVIGHGLGTLHFGNEANFLALFAQQAAGFLHILR